MTLPDRLSNDPRSPFFDGEVLERGVGILFNGREREDVSEYCVSEGWIRVPAGKSKDRFGQPITIKLKGTVEPFAKP
ncbi:MAG: glutathione peroxidase [Mesorhizobium sp. SCN 65-20]|nr:MAG: glutathione peroxidase [Mesorhizobium sp. SCN 65-20]